MIRNAVGLVVLIALSAPSVADAFRVYVRDGPCMGSLAGTGHDDAAAAVSALGVALTLIRHAARFHGNATTVPGTMTS